MPNATQQTVWLVLFRHAGHTQVWRTYDDVSEALHALFKLRRAAQALVDHSVLDDVHFWAEERELR